MWRHQIELDSTVEIAQMGLQSIRLVYVGTEVWYAQLPSQTPTWPIADDFNFFCAVSTARPALSVVPVVFITANEAEMKGQWYSYGFRQGSHTHVLWCIGKASQQLVHRPGLGL